MMVLLTLLLTTGASAGVVQPSAGTGLLEAVYQPRRVAVVIGVQQYSDPALQGLRFAEADAIAIGAALGDPAIGGFDQVWTVTGAEATSAAGIGNAIALATAELQRDDTFLLYLSGHGTLTLDPAEGSRLYFLPSDGVLEDAHHTGLDVAWLEGQVNALAARRRVLILDTCHNGRANSKSALGGATAQLMGGLRGEPPAPRDLREVSESEARLYAAQYYQPAMEDAALGNGVYTHFLLAALTKHRGDADLNRDGLVDVAEAHDYARDRTIRYTAGMQVPRAEYRIVGREEIYLAGDPSKRTSAEHALLSATDQLLSRAKLLVDGVPRGAMPGLTAVDPGTRTVEIQAEDGQTLVRRRVRVEAGSMLSLEDLFQPDAPRWMLGAGAAGRLGPGSGQVSPVAAELELVRLDAFAAPDWLRPDVHLRLNGWHGGIAEQDDVVATGGAVALGASAGARMAGWSLGPGIDLVVPWRSFENSTGEHQQATFTAAPVGRLLWTRQVRGLELGLRYDLRFVPYTSDADWTWMSEQGLAIGLSP
jgi:uncharacterized caspase-like protein